MIVPMANSPLPLLAQGIHCDQDISVFVDMDSELAGLMENRPVSSSKVKTNKTFFMI
jgi:hypothetical protein